MKRKGMDKVCLLFKENWNSRVEGRENIDQNLEKCPLKRCCCRHLLRYRSNGLLHPIKVEKVGIWMLTSDKVC